jgi:hypothetical protein
MIEIPQPLRFYNAAEYQLRHKHTLSRYTLYPMMYVSNTHLLPFVVERIKSNTSIAEYYAQINFTEVKVINIKSLKEYNILSNLTFYFGNYSDPTLKEQVRDCALYPGTSTITALPQGMYYIYLKDDANNEFYSEVFRIWHPEYKVKFEYYNTKSIGKTWFYNNIPYTMQFETIVYSTSVFEEFISEVSDKWNHAKVLRRRTDEIMACDIQCDSGTQRAVEFMMFCDTVYITDELGKRSKIDITEVIHNDYTPAGHISLTIKYRIPENMVTSDINSITYLRGVEGTDPIVETGNIKLGGKNIKLGGKKIKF